MSLGHFLYLQVHKKQVERVLLVLYTVGMFEVGFWKINNIDKQEI
jgi:hypothetical protein